MLTLYWGYCLLSVNKIFFKTWVPPSSYTYMYDIENVVFVHFVLFFMTHTSKLCSGSKMEGKVNKTENSFFLLKMTYAIEKILIFEMYAPFLTTEIIFV